MTGVGKSGHNRLEDRGDAGFDRDGPAHFVHPRPRPITANLGMITSNDAVLALSWSGESEGAQGHRLLFAPLRDFPLVALTVRQRVGAGARGRHKSWPCRARAEACPHGLAPTTLHAAKQLALGDAASLWECSSRRAVSTPRQLPHSIPGAGLGASLTKLPGEFMHVGDEFAAGGGEGTPARRSRA